MIKMTYRFYLSAIIVFSVLTLSGCGGGDDGTSDDGTGDDGSGSGSNEQPDTNPIDEPADTTPNAFAFISQNNVAMNSEVDSSAVTIAGIDSASPISIVGGSYRIDGGAFTDAADSINNGQSVVVRLLAAEQVSTETSATVTIGGETGRFTVTTVAADTVPTVFSFAAQNNVALSTNIDSAGATITGINSPSAISISGGSYRIGSGAFTTSAGEVNNGEVVTVRVSASSLASTGTTATLTIGGISGYFTVTTAGASVNPLSLISVGHSLLGYPHMPAAVHAIAADAGIYIQHNKTQNNPGASLNYNFNFSANSHVDDYEVELANHDFDVFIITEAMAVQSHVQYSDGHAYANAFYDAAIADNPATQFYIWQTWDCRADLGTGNCDAARAVNGLVGQINQDLSTWEGIADAVSAAHGDVSIPIIPGGQALIALDTAINDGDVDGISNIEQVFADDIHLNANGWYFMALVQYATIYKANPAGLTHDIPSYPNTLSTAAAATMQQLAWDTVCQYARSGVSCVADSDDDGDGLSDSEEAAAGTDPEVADSDGDQMPDGYEVTFGLLPTVHDGSTDTDGDGHSNVSEFLASTDPTNNGDYPGMLPSVAGCAADRDAAIDTSINPYSYTGTLKMGHNLGAFAYWESSYPFIDLRRQSDTFPRDLGAWNISGGTATLDANRNIISLPTGSASKGLIGDSMCLYGGDYVVLWNQANAPEVSLIHNGLGTLTLITDDADNGRRVYHLTLPSDMTAEQYKSSNVQVSIDAPIIGNVDYHVLLPGTEVLHNAGGLFNPDFVEDLSGAKMLRFMDWFATNNSDKTSIADLPSMDWDSWADDQGVPYAVAMKLVKEANVPIAWLTIPHQVTAETLAEIARQVYAEWQPGIEVYVEFSNEVWNSGFQQTGYAITQGSIMYPSLDGLNAQSTWLAQKSIEVKQAFALAFGADAGAIKLVVAGHIQTNSYVDTSNLDFCYENCRIANSYNDIANQIDLYAIAPYLAGSLQGPTYAADNDVVNWTDEQFYNHLNADSDSTVTTDLESIISQLADNKSRLETLTGRTDVELSVYEFGQHMSSAHNPYTALDARYGEFQSTAEMGTLYHDLIQAMITAGVASAAQFNLHYEHTVGYYWGSKQGIAGEASPRHQAVEAAY